MPYRLISASLMASQLPLVCKEPNGGCRTKGRKCHRLQFGNLGGNVVANISCLVCENFPAGIDLSMTNIGRLYIGGGGLA